MWCRYNRICGAAKKVTTKLSKLDPTDPFRQIQVDKLLEKLFNVGVIPTQKNLGLVDKVPNDPASLGPCQWTHRERGSVS